MKQCLLQIDNLSVEYTVDQVVAKAVTGLSLSIREGEYVGLVGETGAGKTTTALSIMGLVPDPPGKIPSGRIYFEGKDLLTKTQKDMRKIRGSMISMIFQDPMTSLNPVKTVGSQIMEMVLLHSNMSRSEATVYASQMLEKIGIPASRYNEYPHQFSGGMRQRVVIAIALAANPKLLIADEPTTALDVTIQAQVLELIQALKSNLNAAMLLITHDLGVVSEICDRVAIMYAGNIVEEGSVPVVFNAPKHPYTIGLFGSLPDLDGDATRLKPIKGMMPDPSYLPEGCAFCDRCGHAAEACEKERPALVDIAPDHRVACLQCNSGKEAL